MPSKVLTFLTAAFVLIYTSAALVVVLNRYWQYQNFYFDLGIFDSAIWQVSRFHPPLVDHVDFGSVKILSLGDHFNPSVFLLSPLYWLTSRTEVLLIAQTLAVGLSGLVVFKIGASQLKSKLAVLALVVAFLGYVGLQNALISDFHEATIAVLPLTLIFYAIFNKKWKLYFLLLIILLGLKETFAGLGVGIGLYLLISDRRQNLKRGMLTILISAVWGIAAMKVIIPYFSGGTYLYTPHYLPATLDEAVNRLFYQQLPRQTIFYTFATFGFLPLFNIAVLPAILENFFERYILYFGKGLDLGMHYNATLAPLLFIGALGVFRFLERRFKNTLAVTILSLAIIGGVIFLHRVVLHGPLGLFYNPVFYQQNQGVKYVDNFVGHFPKDGLIMTQNDLAVRLAHYNVALLRRDYQSLSPDHIILNLTEGQNLNSFYPLKYAEAVDLKNRLLVDPQYKKVEKYGKELYIFSKK